MSSAKTETDERLINEISAVQDELEKLGVRRERINFRRLSAEELEVEFDAVGEQLKTRKRFLGVSE